MGTSYYISNVIQYLQGVCNLVDAIDSATKCRWDDVDRYLKIHPDHQYINLSSGKKHKGNKNYVVTTKQQYLGQDGSSILNERNGAMQFHSVEDAYDYIDNHSIPIKDFCVIDNKFKRYRRPEVMEQIRQHLADQPGRRVCINNSTRKLVYEKTNRCYICGKPLSGECSIDHIVPVSKGGNNNIDNLMPVHRDCNRFKNDFSTQELLYHATDIMCYNLFSNPNSPEFAKLTRSYMRGILRAAKERGLV